MSEIEQTQISVLEYPENVRTETSMYLRDINHSIYEIIDNSIDEHAAGYCDTISITIDTKNMSIEVQDNGRGIPITPHPDKRFAGLSQAEVALSVLHSGGKFGDLKSGSYKTATGGCHGVGSACTNATSSKFEVAIATGGKLYAGSFEEGILVNKLKYIQDTNERGTCIAFIPDTKVWGEDATIDLVALEKRIKQMAYLNPGLNMIYVTDSNEPIAYRFNEGIKDFVNDLSIKKDKMLATEYFRTEEDTSKIEVAFTYTTDYTNTITSFVNNIETSDGGVHVQGFKEGLYSAFNHYIEENNLKIEGIASDDIREGMIAIVSLKVMNPSFEGQSKSKLGKMKGIRSFVKEKTQEWFYDFLEKNPDKANSIKEKVLLALKARIAAKNAKDLARNKKNILSSDGSPSKIAACQSKKPEECELFLVEGDSAGGSAKQGRDRKFQAILPVTGKILNTKNETLNKILKSPKMKEFITSLGCGIGDEFNIDKLKYYKIIIMSDADVDGFHIATLFMTLFYEFLRPIIEKGYLYLACSPLYVLEKKKEKVYLYNDAEYEAFDKNGYIVSHIKGLGELKSKTLWETTMNPDNRKLIKITIHDIENAEKYLDICMGNDPSKRRELVQNGGNFLDGNDN